MFPTTKFRPLTERKFFTIPPNFIAPNGVVSEEAFGGDTVRVSPMLYPSSITSLETFGTVSIAAGVAAYSAQILSPVMMFAPFIGRYGGAIPFMGGAQTIQPVGVISYEEFGTQKLNFRLYTNPVLTSEAFGNQKVNFVLRPNGISSTTIFGSFVSTLPSTEMRPFIVSRRSGEIDAFGTPNLLRTQSLLLGTLGISSAEAFGTSKFILYLLPSGVASLEGFGTQKLNFTILTTSIATLEAFGTDTVAPGVVTIVGTGILSGETFGTQRVTFFITTPGGSMFMFLDGHMLM